MHVHLNVKIKGHGLKFSVGYLLVLDLQMSYFKNCLSFLWHIKLTTGWTWILTSMRRGTVSWRSYWSFVSINTTAVSPEFIFAMHPMVHATQYGSLASILCVLNRWLFICWGSLNEQSTGREASSYTAKTNTEKPMRSCFHLWEMLI